MRALLALAALLVSLPAHAEPPFCNAALGAADRIACETGADCNAARPLCTRDFNPQLKHAWAQGSCVDPTGVESVTNALQADLCTIPDPKGWGAFTPYYLPAASRLKLDDPDQDGAAVTIYKRVDLHASGASLATNSNAVIKYAGFRVVVPLPAANQGWTPPTGDKYAILSVLRDLAFESVPIGHENQNTGVLIQANGTKVENIRCWDQGVCVHVNAPGDWYNANHAAVTDVACFGTYGACLYLNGADANDFLGLRIAMNNGPGLLNSGFLNNAFISLSCETCGERHSNLPDYAGQIFSLLDEGSSSFHAAWYLELGDPFLKSTQWSTSFFGGNAGTRTQGPHERFGSGWSMARFGSPGSGYDLWLGRPYEVLLFQAIAGGEHPAEIYAQQLKLRCAGSPFKCDWGLFNEDQFAGAPFTWRSSNVASERTITKISPRLIPGNLRVLAENTQPLCCDGIDNDGDGLTDFFDPQCDPNTMECG